MIDPAYVNTVRLLLDVIPDIFVDRAFAMKGGTAINLFLRDIPRLSVDIDLVYLRKEENRNEALASIAESMQRMADRLERRGLTARPIASGGDPESKLLVIEKHAGASIKIEVNTVFRGSVLPVIEQQPVSPTTIRQFGVQVQATILDPAELYAGKLVAALDRQHPRDLFDVWMLYQNEGLTPELLECFVVYLAGHNRPTHEVLGGNDKRIDRIYEEQFIGMTEIEPPSLSVLMETRARLRRDIIAKMTIEQRDFLIGLASGSPNWALLSKLEVQDLPALRWKLQNLVNFKTKQPTKSAAQTAELRALLFAS